VIKNQTETTPKAKRDTLENPELTKAINKITKNRKIRNAQSALWLLEGDVLTREEILKITGLLQNKKEGL